MATSTSSMVGMIISPFTAVNLEVGSSVRRSLSSGFIGDRRQKRTKSMLETRASRPTPNSEPRHNGLRRPHLSTAVQSLQKSTSSSYENSKKAQAVDTKSTQVQTSPAHVENFEQESTTTSSSSRFEAPNSELFQKSDLHIGQRWREIQGENHWHGLLDPMDRVLATEVIRYGEFAQATYDGFDNNPSSAYCGSCRFGKRNLFEKLSMEDCGYEVTRYLYSTSDIQLPSFFNKPDSTPENKKWSKDSNWIGFVAVCTSPEEIARLGRRDIVIAWRGTVTQLEWLADLQSWQCPTGIGANSLSGGKASASSSAEELKVELGFLSMYASKKEESRFNKVSARDQALGAVMSLMAKYAGEELSITVTGHSMGGALAALCAYDIAESGVNIIQRPSSLCQEAQVDNNPVVAESGVNIIQRPSSLCQEAQVDNNPVEESIHVTLDSVLSSVHRSLPKSLGAHGDSSSVEKFASGTAAELQVQTNINNRPKVENGRDRIVTPVAAAVDGSDGILPDRPRVPVTVYSFAAPRLGNNAFKDRVTKLGVKVLRVVNKQDMVPLFPGFILNERLKFFNVASFPKLKDWFIVKLLDALLDLLPFTYSHVGTVLQLDNLDSPFLKPKWDPSSSHNLEVYLHLLDGFHGESKAWGLLKKEPVLHGGRDLALVNKSTDMLEDQDPEDYNEIPPYWFQEANKGLIMTKEGRFIMPDRQPGDVPELENCQPLAVLLHHD